MSGDDKRFGAHKRNLEVYSDSFPNADWDNLTTKSPVQLVENGIVLVLLLRFMHNATPPDLSQGQLDSNDITGLYKAAEKYGSLAALDACRKEIRSRVKRIEPIESLRIFVQLYAAPSFPDINHVVRRTLSLSHADVLPHINGNAELFYLWSKYHMACQEAKSILHRELDKISNLTFMHAEAYIDVDGEYDANLENCDGGKQYARAMVPILKRMPGYITVEDFDKVVKMATIFGIRWSCKEESSADKECYTDCHEFEMWYKAVKEIIEKWPRWEDVSKN
ncbi:hypothetical protein VNI00_010240 [Paramarasmius palmivorus]|uniref:BTB domain-containing protein n=1 Tax=Paramarasmius palmivorus TaxID=297713 RepID=A0AAW0BW12_9AGAR